MVPGRLGCRAWPTPRASFSVRAPFSLFRSTSGRAPFGHRARTDTVSPFGHRAPCRTPSLEKTGHRSGTVQGVVARRPVPGARCPVPGGCHNLQRTCRRQGHRRCRTPRSSCRPGRLPWPMLPRSLSGVPRAKMRTFLRRQMRHRKAFRYLAMLKLLPAAREVMVKNHASASAVHLARKRKSPRSKHASVARSR